MAYKTIKESFWTDPKISQLTPDEKFLFLYCVTNPHSHYSGIYYLPIVFMIEETGMSSKVLNQCLTNLESRLLIHYDKVTSTIFVVKMFRHQNSTGGNPKVLRSGIEKQLQNIHSHLLINAFIKEYQYLNLTLPEGFGNVESTLHQGSVTVTVTDPVTDPDKSKSKKNKTIEFELPSFVSKENWEAFEEMRNKIKKPMTKRAKELIINELVKLRLQGHDANLVLEQSIKNNYQDVYPLKNKQTIPDYEKDNAFDKIKKDRFEFERSLDG